MADVIIGGAGSAQVLKRLDQLSGMVISYQSIPAGTIAVNYATANAGNASVQADMDQLRLGIDIGNAYTMSGVSFDRGGKKHMVKGNGDVQVDLDPSTGVGTKVGEATAAAVNLDEWAAGSTPVVTNFRGLAAPPIDGPFSRFGDFEVMFRTAVAPLKPESVSIIGKLKDGTVINVVSDEDGFFNSSRVKGKTNYNTGVVDLFAVSPTGFGDQTTQDLSFLGIPGVSDVYLDQFDTESLRYNAVAFAYLPVDAELLGIDPVRLPSDGRVPIFKPSYVALVGSTRVTAPATAANAGTVNVGAVRLSRIRVIGNNNITIIAGYTADLETGIVTWVDVTGYSQPVRVEYREQDMVQIIDAGIDGTLRLNKALSHAYPASRSYVSSLLTGQDLISRVSTVFDLATFDSTFSDTPGAQAPLAEYNDTDFPILVTNKGAITQKWQIQFTGPTAFKIIGQNVGQIGIGATNEDTAPINPNHPSVPYFVIPEGGWGSGWANGNCLRFNTVAAGFSAWLLRTTRPSEAAGDDYSFSVLIGGGIDNPIP